MDIYKQLDQINQINRRIDEIDAFLDSRLRQTIYCLVTQRWYEDELVELRRKRRDLIRALTG